MQSAAMHPEIPPYGSAPTAWASNPPFAAGHPPAGVIAHYVRSSAHTSVFSLPIYYAKIAGMANKIFVNVAKRSLMWYNQKGFSWRTAPAGAFRSATAAGGS